MALHKMKGDFIRRFCPDGVYAHCALEATLCWAILPERRPPSRWPPMEVGNQKDLTLPKPSGDLHFTRKRLKDLWRD
jgi:hypothetical protein